MLTVEHTDDKGTLYNPVLQKNIWEYATGKDVLKEVFPNFRLVYVSGLCFKITVPSPHVKGRITLTGTFRQTTKEV